ncbi:MAG: YqgE/AlgH family protein [Gammaproteobacteria bacterium]|nr:YqgE/AlgH family protein [Gammaproteobacteria bacterium]
MTETSYLTGHFLIAMPNLQDPNFLRTVTYICEHNEKGAFGVVINRQLDAKITEILQQLSMPYDESNEHVTNNVFVGGPVEVERGLILHSPVGNWDSTLVAHEEIGLTSSLDIMRSIAENAPPEQFFVMLGYAGWDAGQLEQELADNSWLHGPADKDIIFNMPISQRWDAAAKLLGIDISLLSSDVGHA